MVTPSPQRADPGLYSVGDVIVYGSIGVCRVEAIGVPPVEAADAERTYYTLVPLYKGGHIYAPVDTSTYMRPVLSRAEALSLIRDIPSVDESTFETSQLGLLREHYQALLGSHDCLDLVHVIKSVYVKRRSLVENGKSLGQVEAQYVRQAEEMLYDELAVALDVPREEVKTYVEEAVDRIVGESVPGAEGDPSLVD